MATIAGTIRAVVHAHRSFTGITGPDSGNSNAAVELHAFLVSVNFGAYVAAADTFSIAGVGAAIGTYTRDGKTYTLRDAMVVGFGKNSAGTAITCSAVTVSTDALTGNLTDIAGTEIDVPLGTVSPLMFMVTATCPA